MDQFTWRNLIEKAGFARLDDQLRLEKTVASQSYEVAFLKREVERLTNQYKSLATCLDEFNIQVERLSKNSVSIQTLAVQLAELEFQLTKSKPRTKKAAKKT